MKEQSILIRNSILFLLVFLTVIYRILAVDFLPHWANFTPFGAVAIFSGVYFKPTWKAFLLPVSILFVSDFFVNKLTLGTYNPFYGGMLGVYMAFILMTILGLINKKITILSVLLNSILAVFVHWIITDIHPWLASVPSDGIFYYTKDTAGFVKCLMTALPFEVNFLRGTLLFNFLLFGSFELLKSKFVALRIHNESQISIF